MRIVSILFIISFSSCVSYKPIMITEINDVKTTTISSEKAELSFNVEVNNPNGYKIVFNEYDVNVFINEKLKGNRLKSVIREEITQSFGLANDSWEYPDSIFFQGTNSQITFSELDKEIINELYTAAKTGVPIEILARGICTLKLSEIIKHGNVKVFSVLGRFLEHSRIYNFYDGGKNVYYIGSADIMERNLNRRVEILTEIVDTKHKERMDYLLETPFSGKYQHWMMNDDDSWEHIKRDKNGELLKDLHQTYIERFAK